MDDEVWLNVCWMMGIVLERALGIEGEIKLKVVELPGEERGDSREGEAQIENEKVNWGCQRQNERQQRRRLKMIDKSGRREEGRRVKGKQSRGRNFTKETLGRGGKKIGASSTRVETKGFGLGSGTALLQRSWIHSDPPIEAMELAAMGAQF